jgi:CheY-like chemotaxis protein
MIGFEGAPASDPLARVLVADADVMSLELYAHALHLSSSEITLAADGRDALVKALEYPFALVITETHLPLIDGYALCDVIRHDAATRDMPIMVVTADARPTSLNQALLAGADVALTKPIVPDVLRAEARQLLLSSSAERLIKRSRELREQSDHTTVKVSALLRKSDNLLNTGWNARGALTKTHQRYDTTQPPTDPPPLWCPSCHSPLTYEISHVGGVSARLPEQWDDYLCPHGCGRFQYRRRTRKLRAI